MTEKCCSLRVKVYKVGFRTAAFLTMAGIVIVLTGCSQSTPTAAQNKKAWAKSAPPPEYHGPGEPGGPPSGPPPSGPPAGAKTGG